MRTTVNRTGVFVAGLFALLASWAAPVYGQSLRIYHIDVEQADATLFVAPSGNTLLVDSGKNGHGARIKAVMDEAKVTQIDFFVATHYHEDHYGGIDDLIGVQNVTVARAFDRGDKDELGDDKRSQATFLDYEEAVGKRAEQLSRGETIKLDPAMTVTCISSGGMVMGEESPTSGVDENDMSISLLVEFGGFRYFVGGDIELTTEGKIADRNLVLKVDIYQANHHGSHTSSSPPFVSDMSPTVVIISNGNHGGFQHPRQHTLDLLASMDPAPTVFQTNQYFKGGSGGNVDVEFIADPETTDKDGTILVTVTPADKQYVITYPDASLPFNFKPGPPNGVDVVIESVLPRPKGSDRKNEEVTLKNKSAKSVSLGGWSLRDADNHVASLTRLGQVEVGQSVVFKRNGSSLSLNDDKDTIFLLDPDNQVVDEFSYTGSKERQRIDTGH